MEPVRLHRQQQVIADHNPDFPQTPEDQLGGPLAAVKLAESGDFPRLLVALALRPRLARAADAFGMTALHWVCSDPRVPPRVVLTVARAHPGAAATRNLAGLLPLHLAIRKHLALEAIQTLLQVYPRAVAVRMPDGKTPLALAKQRPAAPNAVLTLLKVLETHSQTGVPSSLALPTQWQDKPNEEPQEIGRRSMSERFSTARSTTQEETIAHVLAPPTPPPRWALAERCRLCAAKFGYFRQRHHCRSCGSSVCGKHSRHRVPLKHLGLFQPQRVCACCFDELQNQLNVRALERVTRTGGAYPFIDNGDSRSEFQNNSMFTSARYRRRSKSVYSEPTQYHDPVLDWAYDQDNNQTASTNEGFTPVSPPYHNWSTASSEVVESVHPSMGSMFLSVAPAQPTVLERQRQLRQQQQDHPVEFMSEPSRRRSRQRRPRPHSSALDRALHVQRLSEVASDHSSDEQELEQRMQQLMIAKRELGEAMRRSEEEISIAEREKHELDQVVNRFRKSGYSSPPEYEDDEDEEEEIAATLAFLNGKKRMSSTAELLEDFEPPLDLAATHHELGEALLSKGDFAGAVMELQRSVDLDCENAATWLHLAKALDGNGEDSESAEEAVRRALELDPSSIGALSLLGKLLHLRGDHDDAILVFRQALALQCPTGKLSSGFDATVSETERISVTM